MVKKVTQKVTKKVTNPGRGGQKCPAPSPLRPPRPSGLHGFHYPLLFGPPKTDQKKKGPKMGVQILARVTPPLLLFKIYSIYLYGGGIPRLG